MFRRIIGAILALSLAGCSSANIAANEAAVQKFFQTADADLQAAYAGILQNCSAIEALVIDAQVIACLSKASTSTQNSVSRGVAAAQSVCNGPQPSAATMGNVVATIATAYRAAKTAQLGNGCGA